LNEDWFSDTSYWQVWDKSGTLYVMGHVANTNSEFRYPSYTGNFYGGHTDTTLSWKLATMTNTSNITYTYKYATEG